jgi:hypothetical protein
VVLLVFPELGERRRFRNVGGEDGIRTHDTALDRITV